MCTRKCTWFSQGRKATLLVRAEFPGRSTSLVLGDEGAEFVIRPCSSLPVTGGDIQLSLWQEAAEACLPPLGWRWYDKQMA